MSEVDALYSLQLTKRLKDPSEEASLWTDTDPSLIGILRWFLDWCLEEYDPRSIDNEVRLRFLEFIEQVVLYREACRVEDFLSYAIKESQEVELVSAIMTFAKDMIIPGHSVSITTEDVLEAVGLYSFMKEGRDILMAPMGRALIRAAQLGGDRWKHLYHIKNGPILWDGKDEGEMPILEDKVAGLVRAKEVMREEHLLFHRKEPSIYAAVCNEIQRACTEHVGAEAKKVAKFRTTSLTYGLFRTPYWSGGSLSMGPMLQHAIGNFELEAKTKADEDAVWIA